MPFTLTHPQAVAFVALDPTDGTLRGDATQPTVFSNGWQALAAILNTIRVFNMADWELVRLEE